MPFIGKLTAPERSDVPILLIGKLRTLNCVPDSVVGFLANENKSDVRFVKYFTDTIKKRVFS